MLPILLGKCESLLYGTRVCNAPKTPAPRNRCPNPTLHKEA